MRRDGRRTDAREDNWLDGQTDRQTDRPQRASGCPSQGDGGHLRRDGRRGVGARGCLPLARLRVQKGQQLRKLQLRAAAGWWPVQTIHVAMEVLLQLAQHARQLRSSLEHVQHLQQGRACQSLENDGHVRKTDSPGAAWDTGSIRDERLFGPWGVQKPRVSS
jgi:hypothetical protein